MLPYETQQYGSSGFIDLVKAIKNGQIELIVAVVGIGLLGTYCVYGISKLISKFKVVQVSKIFGYIGITSIGIYLLHNFFVTIWFQQYLWNNYWITTLFALGVSIGLYEILKQINVLNWLLFGGGNIPKKITNKLISTNANNVVEIKQEVS